MIEEAIEIRTSAGISDSYLYRAEDGRQLPGVIHLTEIGGVRPTHQVMVSRLVAQGYTVLMPNM